MTDAEVRDALPAAGPILAMALTGYGEARGESLDGKVAVMHTIHNRFLAGRFGATITAVCLAPKQFSCWTAGDDPNHGSLLLMAEHALDRTRRVDPLLREFVFLAQGIVNRDLRDSVFGATHYLTKELLERKPPAWARGQSPIVEIGRHVFFIVP